MFKKYTVMAASAAMLGSTGGAMFVGADALMGDGTPAPEDSAMQDTSTSSTNTVLTVLLLVCLALLIGLVVRWYYKKKRP